MPPNIDPLFVSVETEQSKASTPVGPPLMIPLPRTVIEPPVLRIVPEWTVEMVCGSPLQATAAPGAPSAASATSDAPASKAPREPRPPAAVKELDEYGSLCELGLRLFAPMTTVPPNLSELILSAPH